MRHLPQGVHVTPRPGGEADKIGNRYELGWAIRHALLCLGDRGESLTLEEVDVNLGQGAEFTFATGSSVEVHQLKRQNGNSNSWSVKILTDLKVLEAAALHVKAGRELHFVSLVPCRPLQELADRARRSDDLATFTQSWLTTELRAVFDQLAGVLGHPQATWETLRGTWFSVQDEAEIVRTNAMLAELQMSGAPGSMIALATGDILLDNLGRRLTRTTLLELLSDRDIYPRRSDSRRSAGEQLHAVTDSWRDSVQRELLDPRIERDESARTIEALDNHRIAIVSGTAGGGKSSVLEQTVENLEASGAHVLALRLDRMESFASTRELGRQLGLETSPSVVLAVASDDCAGYMVIDQLDAVSLASGRIPASFDVVMDLIREVLTVGNLRVVLACREFDINNDHRIRSLTDRDDTVKVSVNLLTGEAVDTAVTAMGLNATKLSSSQRSILQTPMHLVLLHSIAAQDNALAFQSRGSLFEAYWERKRQMARAKRASIRFSEVLSRVANAASDRQTLSVPVETLDQDELIEDANVLVSEHVLSRDGDRIAFFHETFFDYAFARQWVSRSESLTDFLLRDEQELFRRGQVRQILQHLYEREPTRFRTEALAVLTSDQVRFHIKETVWAVLANLNEPTSEDAEAIFDLAAMQPGQEEEIWRHVRSVAWFARFLENGNISVWLDAGEPTLRQRSLDLMVNAVRDLPDEVAELLGARRNAPEYPIWLRRIARHSDLHQSRKLFDLVLGAVRAGEFDAVDHGLWLGVHDLAKQQPLWAIELIEARFIEHPSAFVLDESGKVALLSLREYSATKLVKDAAELEPLAFAQAVIPYLCRVMAASAYEARPNRRTNDRHFWARFELDERPDSVLDMALFAASARALETLVAIAPDDARPLLDQLAKDPHAAARFLLYRAMAVGNAAFANSAAELLLEEANRIEHGHVPDSEWEARELLNAIAPLLTDAVHEELERAFRDLRNTHEDRLTFGLSAFKFVSALEEHRLTPAGARRLGEYRRKFSEGALAKPRPGTSGFIGSPIEHEAALKMSDSQWLGAMAKYNDDQTNWQDLTGGARELSHVLREQAKRDPKRFAIFALKITLESNSAFADALLMGFADARASDEIAPLIFDSVRHLALLGHEDVDRWLGNALRQYYHLVPLELVEVLLTRALESRDPRDDSPIISIGDSDRIRASDMHTNAINTARGSLAEALGDLLVHDVQGARTALLRPHLDTFASDPVLFVRSTVAHTLSAALRHARPEAVSAFRKLIEADDQILASPMVQHLMVYIGNVDPGVITPVIRRMLLSQDPEAREAGGALAAFAALEWNEPSLLVLALEGDSMTRKGVAEVCTRRIDQTSNTTLASETLKMLMYDGDQVVREAAAEIAPHLRNHQLRPFADLLATLIASPAYSHATPQLFITLQNAPDKVDDLVLKASKRFISVFGSEAADIRTGAAGDAHYISELVVRGLAQSRDKNYRASLLDILDELLKTGVYGVGEAIAESERL